ncbi:hypothetical protein C8R46DRAFT_1001679 [Mycena filopes]|nr:hypothetical protein C8R46DRAFT_1001679 [Mycena filopes]
MRVLRDLQASHKTVRHGNLKPPFHLTITRAGCEYDDEMNVGKEGVKSGKKNRKGGKKNVKGGDKNGEPEVDIGERLRRWYEAGAVSAYGDVKAQETKIDPAVRNAREIPASEFSVSPDLITKVQDIWAHRFFPTQVRAEPYKIHLYGPGGKFKPHLDTPETDLVGTFLLGLGDTSKTKGDGERGALEIQGDQDKEKHRYRANVGHWVAFYPDVDHGVREIASGYRAVIAFKIFRQPQNTPEVPADGMLHQIKDVLAELNAPYGILLHHRYSIRTAELNGFDAALYAAAGETGADVKLLSVLIQWSAYNNNEEPAECDAEVFPITDAHVDAILEHLRTSTDDNKRRYVEWKKKPKLVVNLKGTEAEWLSTYQIGTGSIPFYSHELKSTSVTWRETIKEGIEYTGNESRPHSEDSIYLSYTVVVLPAKRGVKRAAREEGGEDNHKRIKGNPAEGR